MGLDIGSLLKAHPELVLFVLLTLAYLIGRIKVGKLDLGAPPGVLIAGLLFGYWGFTIIPGIEAFGLFLFLYAVAFQAGPAFFTVVLADGKQYVGLAAIATLMGLMCAYGVNLVFNFPPGTTAGLLAGSLTAPAGVAAALQTVATTPIAATAEATVASITQNISASYAITYLVGDVAVILLARSLPGWFGFDLRAEANRAALEKNVVEADGSIGNQHTWSLTLRAYQVNSQILVGKTIAELQTVTQCSVLRHKRDNLLIDLHPDMPVELGDRLSMWGKVEYQDLLDELFGAEVADQDLLTDKITNYELTVTQPVAIGKTLQELDITNRYACYLSRVMRAGIDLAVSPDLQIARGDVLTLSGPHSHLQELTEHIGYVEQNINATDLVTFAAGVVVGFLIGQIRIQFGSLAIGLGTAGGLLLVGLILGYLRSIHPTFGRVPPAVLWVFKELGLLLFLAGVGIEGGKGLAEIKSGALLLLIVLCSLVISTMPVIVAFLYGRQVLRMNPALLLGAVTGSVTCTPAMAAVSEDAQSSIPTIGYAGTYAFATVFQAIACSLIALM